jgi:hypothetical protein
MTEAEWLVCKDAQTMLLFRPRGEPNERKLRLFACACCRRMWTSLPTDQDRFAVAIAEQYADGLIGDEQVLEVRAQMGGQGHGEGVSLAPTLCLGTRRGRCRGQGLD